MSRRIVIIGGGVIGLCTAYYCAKKGHRVTVIERNGAGRDGCSFGNAGMIVPSHFVPLAAPGMVALGLKWMWNPESLFYVKPRLSSDLLDWGCKFWRAANAAHVRRCAPLLRDLSFSSRECFEEFAAEPGNDFGLVQRGLLMLCKTRHALDEEAKAAQFANDLGVPAQLLDARQAAALDPGVTMDIAGAVYFPKDCHLTPARFMGALQSRCERLGVQFAWDVDVTGFVLNATRIAAVKTSREEFEAEEFVLCGGSWSQVIATGLGLKIPLQAGKGYSLTLPKPRQLPGICAIFAEARVAVTPMDGALRFGGTMEIAGLNEAVNAARVRGIVKSVSRYYPEFTTDDFAGIEPWVGLRPCSPDGMPYIGRTAKFSNLCIATGHAMMGLSLGPVTGGMVARILSDETSQFDLAPMSPDRFA